MNQKYLKLFYLFTFCTLQKHSTKNNFYMYLPIVINLILIILKSGFEAKTKIE
jgi:hypothetical protein